MRSSVVLFIGVALCVATVTATQAASAPKQNQEGAPSHSAAVKEQLKRMGLSDEWYSSMLSISKPTPSLEMPAPSPQKSKEQPETAQPVEQPSLLQEKTELSAEDLALLGDGSSAGANPTYILPQNPWASNYPFPPPSPFAYNPYAPTAYGYSQPYANPSYAPGGGAGGGAGGGVAFAPGGASNIAAPSDNDFFASAPIQPAAHDPSFIYPAPNFINPLYVSPRMPNGAFAYYSGFASAIPQGPLSDPTPFPVGTNPPNDFPKFRQRLHPSALQPTSFAEESSQRQSSQTQTQGQTRTQQGQGGQNAQAAAQAKGARSAPNSRPQKRLFRPDIVGAPSGKDNDKPAKECINCHFES